MILLRQMGAEILDRSSVELWYFEYLLQMLANLLQAKWIAIYWAIYRQSVERADHLYFQSGYAGFHDG